MFADVEVPMTVQSDNLTFWIRDLQSDLQDNHLYKLDLYLRDACIKTILIIMYCLCNTNTPVLIGTIHDICIG